MTYSEVYLQDTTLEDAQFDYEFELAQAEHEVRHLTEQLGSSYLLELVTAN